MTTLFRLGIAGSTRCPHGCGRRMSLVSHEAFLFGLEMVRLVRPSLCIYLDLARVSDAVSLTVAVADKPHPESTPSSTESRGRVHSVTNHAVTAVSHSSAPPSPLRHPPRGLPSPPTALNAIHPPESVIPLRELCAGRSWSLKGEERPPESSRVTDTDSLFGSSHAWTTRSIVRSRSYHATA